MSDEHPRQYASSPCYQHEFETAGLIARLNELVEGERAGARSLIQMTAGRSADELNAVLGDVARDEARFCSMLRRHVTRLGGTPSERTGVFLDKFIARESELDRLKLLDRGQSAVVCVLDELLGQPLDQPLRTDLEEMRQVHIDNIERCGRFLPDQCDGP